MFGAATKQPMARQPVAAARQLVAAIKQPVAMARQPVAAARQLVAAIKQPEVVARQPVEL